MPDEDATDIPFVTSIPPAAGISTRRCTSPRTGDGYLVSYAIADVAAFVTRARRSTPRPMRRGETLYFPDVRVPLHPPSLGEGAASLLPGQVRPAVLWRIELDAAGAVHDRGGRASSPCAQPAAARLRRLCSVELEAGSAPEPLPLLARHRSRCVLAHARRRHAIDLDLPEQDVGRRWRDRVAADDASTAAGRGVQRADLAAHRRVRRSADARQRVGSPAHRADTRCGAVGALRRAAQALGVDLAGRRLRPATSSRSLDRGDPRPRRLPRPRASLLRGAAYMTFDGAAARAAQHAGIGAPYAHVTAPLRRLVDRYASEVVPRVADRHDRSRLGVGRAAAACRSHGNAPTTSRTRPTVPSST